MSGTISVRKRSTISIRARTLLIFHEAILIDWVMTQRLALRRVGRNRKRPIWKDPRSGGMERGSTERSSRWRVPDIHQNLRATGGNLAGFNPGTAMPNIAEFPVANMNEPLNGPY